MNVYLWKQMQNDEVFILTKYHETNPTFTTEGGLPVLSETLWWIKNNSNLQNSQPSKFQELNLQSLKPRTYLKG